MLFVGFGERWVRCRVATRPRSRIVRADTRKKPGYLAGETQGPAIRLAEDASAMSRDRGARAIAVCDHTRVSRCVSLISWRELEPAERGRVAGREAAATAHITRRSRSCSVRHSRPVRCGSLHSARRVQHSARPDIGCGYAVSVGLAARRSFHRRARRRGSMSAIEPRRRVRVRFSAERPVSRPPGLTARSRKFGLTQRVEQPQQRQSIGLLGVGMLDRVRRAAQLDAHPPATVHAVKAVERAGEQFAQLRLPG
jgi:hypothetical protein